MSKKQLEKFLEEQRKKSNCYGCKWEKHDKNSKPCKQCIELEGRKIFGKAPLYEF